MFITLKPAFACANLVVSHLGQILNASDLDTGCAVVTRNVPRCLAHEVDNRRGSASRGESAALLALLSRLRIDPEGGDQQD